MKILRSVLCRRSQIHSMMAAANAQSRVQVQPQAFDYFLVLDFEATCDNTQPMEPQEIIEFPVLKFNWKTLQVESQFHEYVQPRVHKQLTHFCTELTGIVQEMVDGKPYIEDVIQKFEEWMQKEILSQNASFIFVTCGDWDLKKMLPKQCQYFNIQRNPYFNSWINIKKSFADVTKTYPKGMMPMLEQLGIQHLGRHHSGIDDTRNIANILKALLERGYVFKTNGRL